MREHERIAGELRKKVTRAQELVDELAKLCLEEVRRLDEEYCRALPQLPQGLTMVALSRELPGLVARRFEAQIRGNLSCRGTIETGHQLLQSGKVDLLNAVGLYLQTGASALGHNHSPPPKAA